MWKIHAEGSQVAYVQHSTLYLETSCAPFTTKYSFKIEICVDTVGSIFSAAAFITAITIIRDNQSTLNNFYKILDECPMSSRFKPPIPTKP